MVAVVLVLVLIRLPPNHSTSQTVVGCSVKPRKHLDLLQLRTLLQLPEGRRQQQGQECRLMIRKIPAAMTGSSAANNNEAGLKSSP